MLPNVREYNAAIVARAGFQDQVDKCFEPTCKYCSLYSQCQERVDNAHRVLVSELFWE